jgi:hypothetical protein
MRLEGQCDSILQEVSGHLRVAKPVDLVAAIAVQHQGADGQVPYLPLRFDAARLNEDKATRF